MKVVILAGGFGTRISEESVLKPKPMVEIGDKPILWHIMKLYSHYGYNEFVICCGYKQHMIKEWFADYYLHSCDVTFDFTRENKMTVHNNISEPWKVTLVDTVKHMNRRKNKPGQRTPKRRTILPDLWGRCGRYQHC